jgi:2'-5' RNA ligase
MRCFIAIDVDEKLFDKITELQKGINKLNVDVKLVEPENLHFTVKFLGDMNEDEVNEIKNSLGECLKNEHEFKINITGFNYFGNPSYIRTLWLDVKEGQNELKKLVQMVNDCVKIGKLEVLPHLTLGRVKSPINKDYLIKFINENKNVKIGEMNVNYVKLKASTLTKNGPVYNNLAVFNLVPCYE